MQKVFLPPQVGIFLMRRVLILSPVDSFPTRKEKKHFLVEGLLMRRVVLFGNKGPFLDVQLQEGIFPTQKGKEQWRSGEPHIPKEFPQQRVRLLQLLMPKEGIQ